MAACSYSTLVGGDCGSSTFNPGNAECVIVSQCNRDIRNHLKLFAVSDSALDTESKLLLARAGVFDKTEELSIGYNVCPRHRDQFGVRWRCNKKSCACPIDWSGHGTQPPKGDRGITVEQSKRLFKFTKILIPVGSPICRRCRERLRKVEDMRLSYQCKKLEEQSECQEQDTAFQEEESQSDQISEMENTEENDFKELCAVFKNMSLANLLDEPTSSPSSSVAGSSHESLASSTSSDACLNTASLAVRRRKLNEFLSSCDLPSVGPSKNNFGNITSRAKQNRIIKTKDAVVAVLNVIAPGEPGLLWDALKASRAVEQLLNIESDDNKYLDALAETYRNASTCDTRRQILSIMADLTTLEGLRQYIPGLTEYRFKIARMHRLKYGRGVPLPLDKSPRMRVNMDQLDHFLSFITSSHVIQDLPFGQRYLHLSSGEILETPNVIRTIIPQRIVQQYQQYCQESNFKPFGSSTMLRILSCCSATVRRSLQGLDYFSAEGAKAFDDLYGLLDRVEAKSGVDRKKLMLLKKDLKEGKQYLKTDYKVHISKDSRVADHCMVYALGDSKNNNLESTCSHVHDEFCQQCEAIQSALEETKKVLKEIELSNDERDDLMYLYGQATQAIQAWKCHQLRSIRQDMSRTFILDTSLDENSIFLTQDWAMKFLPQRYRETQADWYGKRGISWHISVVVTKVGGIIKQQAFIHIAKSCSQDSVSVVRMLDHTLRTLKTEHPELSKVFLRQDNGACYHSSLMLSSCQQMKAHTGIGVARVDFSDPQGGKGACDRKAAVIKAHVRRYINEGHDVNTPEEFREAILSNGGIRGVRVAVIDAKVPPDIDGVGPKWDGVSFLNNFEYTKKGITAWRAYDIGIGKQISSKKFCEALKLNDCQFTEKFSPGDFVDISIKKKAEKPSQTVNSQDSEPEDQGNNLFTCPNAGCTSEYQRYFGLEKHMSYGKCHLAPERETLMDKAKVLYTSKLIEGTSANLNINPTVLQKESEGGAVLALGWALKTSKKANRFNEKQTRYLDDKFKIGEETGNKADPAAVAKDMRFTRDSEGKRLFNIDEFLTAQQIKSYFSRMSKKARQGGMDTPDQADDDDDELAAEDEDSYHKTREHILQEVQLNHPIVYDTLNICSLYSTKKLTHLGVSVLRSVCGHFDLAVDHIQVRRKAPYINLIKELVESCACQGRI